MARAIPNLLGISNGNWDVLKLLMDSPDALGGEEISKRLDLSQGGVSPFLNKLVEVLGIERKEIVRIGDLLGGSERYVLYQDVWKIFWRLFENALRERIDEAMVELKELGPTRDDWGGQLVRIFEFIGEELEERSKWRERVGLVINATLGSKKVSAGFQERMLKALTTIRECTGEVNPEVSMKLALKTYTSILMDEYRVSTSHYFAYITIGRNETTGKDIVVLAERFKTPTEAKITIRLGRGRLSGYTDDLTQVEVAEALPCSVVKPLIDTYLTRTLYELEHEQFKDHFDDCRECREEMHKACAEILFK